MIKRFDSTDKNVSKYVFTKDGVRDFKAVYEAVLYRYGSFEERTVICCSVQSGCPVGCTFCGTGDKFVRNLKSWEIVDQIIHILRDMKIDSQYVKKFQIMFMSMGEPILNYSEVTTAIYVLNQMYPNADLLISTIAPYDMDHDIYKHLLDMSTEISKIGLQFSIHKSTDKERNVLIPYKNKMKLDDIAYYGWLWHISTGRKPYCNYCIDGTNNTRKDAERLFKLFPASVFNFTFSVVCSADETMKEAGYKNLKAIEAFQQMFLENGYNTRVFNPEGQDDIGGGCGQLWYVQQWMKEQEKL